jgi:phage shock protein PspC (stress-responsive transcriptional regulator)
MKKIININFHSRVIPIEETAYDILQKYLDNLRKHFAAEEGGDEIVNDIENRFAELFSESLKKGASCITDDEVNATITNMGHPEDFDQEENTRSAGTTGNTTQPDAEARKEETHRSLYRSENDKMLGGICGGLAAYLRMDSSIVRIIYALLILGSFGTALLLYIILWIVLPPKSMVTSVRKKLYRNPDQRVIGGVASGLSAYFNIEVWIPRVIFALPLILGFVTSIFRHAWFDWDRGPGPVFLTGGFGGTLFITYIILWIVLPEANTASEKLEMRGEKIDIESIKNTIRGDLEGFKQKASQMGEEVKKQAQQFGSQMKDRSGPLRNMSTGSTARHGIGHAIGVLFKAFFLFIAAIITFGLVMALIGILFTGAGVLPLKHYILSGFWQNLLAWSALILFLVLPVIGLLTWLIRRIIGARKGSNYLGYIFGSLWVVGLICMLSLIASVSSDFRTRAGMSDEINLTTPANGRLIVKISNPKESIYESDWMGINWQHNSPFFEVTEDSLTLNTVRIDVTKSTDSSWHLRRDKLSRGSSTAIARNLAAQIVFDVQQQDSLLYVPAGFLIHPKEQFRNQQVLLVVEMPVGKKIRMDKSLGGFRWFDLHRNSRNGVGIDWDDNGDNTNSSMEADVDYTMTEHGLERSSGKSAIEEDKSKSDDQQDDQDRNDKKEDAPKDGYRYHKKEVKKTAKAVTAECNKDGEIVSPLILFTKWS